MTRRDLVWLVMIIIVVVAAIWIVQNPDFPIMRGLDLQGGLQVLMEADVPADEASYG